MKSKDTLVVEWIQAGQPRAYADSIYEANISKLASGTLIDGSSFYINFSSKERVEELAKLLIHPFVDKEPKDREWHESYLEICEPIGPTQEMIDNCKNQHWQPEQNSRWHVRIIVPYCD